MKRIFVSSVQKEFEKDRLAIKRMVDCDPIIKAYYETFVFEIDAPAADKSTQEVYLNGTAADDVDEIPNSVITEAVNNAIAHRNYANNGSIQVEVYQDRVEVISPGRLMPPLTVESLYGKHESVAPNPHIAHAMFWVKYIETVGTGLNELMGACAKAGLKRPTIEANDIHFRLIIWRREVVALPDKLPDKLPDNCPINASTKDRTFAYIRTHPGCSRQQIAESIGLSVESVKLALAALREGSAKIEHRGSNKTGGYYAKELEIGK